MKTNKNFMLLLLGTIGFLTNGDIYSAAPLLINIAADLNITLSSSALTVTAYMLAFGLFTIFLGPLGDRYGKSKIIIISSFGTALFSCLSVFASSLETLIVFRFANGAFAAGIMPVSMAIIGETFEESKRQNAIAKLMGMMLLGGASATVIGGALSHISSWKAVYFAYGIAELITAFFLLAYLEKKPGSLKRLNYFQIYRESLGNAKLLSVLFVIALTGFCVLGSFAFSGELIKQKTNLNILQIGAFLSLFGIAGIFGSKIAAQLREKTGNRICIIAGIAGAVSLAVLSRANGVVFLALALIGFGLSFIFLHSTLIATAQSVIPKLKGTIMALVSFCMFFGSGIGTIANKQILENSGISIIFMSASILFFFIGIAGLFVLNNIQFKKLAYTGP